MPQTGPGPYRLRRHHGLVGPDTHVQRASAAPRRPPPLDFRYQRDNFSFYFPLGTSILLSIILSLIFMAINRR